MKSRIVRNQLIVFGVVTVITLLVLGIYYLRLPSVAGIGQYTLKAELPTSGGLYPTANVTYRGATIGKVTSVEPTRTGAQVTMSINDRYQIPIDATANVHSVSAVGEQYLDLVSEGAPGKTFLPGQTITEGTVPEDIGEALDAVERGLAALPKDKIAALLDETSQAVGGLGPALHRLVDSTQSLSGEFEANTSDINDIIANSAPLLNSQAASGDEIRQWIHNLSVVAAQIAQKDPQLKNVLTTAAPTLDTATGVLGGVRESLPQTLANLEVVTGLLLRYRQGVEQVLVLLPQVGSVAQTTTLAFPGEARIDLGLAVNQPPPCLTGFVPASQWRSPADTSIAPLPAGTYCKIPQETTANAVRGARNIPCVDVAGRRAATPQDCRSGEPYVPLGTNPWYGDPNQIRNCPAPAARCDQPVQPGRVIPAPTINTGLNPLPADQLPGTPPPISDPLSPPGTGTVQCNGQQPNPCVYTPAGPPTPTYETQSGQITGPDGVKYSVDNTIEPGDDGWKRMLAPAG
ncbi:MCE family protein [Mycolicibacterium sp. jd]|uniref:MCE family protein n=1 Tax=Mycolicibacterium austroafricanum TaxID=39687 RepID=A0ABT8HM54_MYCAO|nr:MULTISPECIES: MlaD family protein [Mycolicibacterium]MDN4521847.1 MCE family protein [Mycolicibacterium austroafricanum]UJL30595.1 MCE family protein [Mycolicibacterium vanbaalenii]WND56299.1 MCE family protein [Mycolicibacterium vanbaalenii]